MKYKALENRSIRFDLIIVGGGASGIAAALAASKVFQKNAFSIFSSGHALEMTKEEDILEISSAVPILLLEKQDGLGKKLTATGNGRCNLSNESISTSCYHWDNPGPAPDILKSFGADDARSFFMERGILTKSIDGYLYPYNEQAQTVRDLLEEELLKDPFVKVLTNTGVERIVKEDHGYRLYCPGRTFLAKKLIMATGGYAGPVFGCFGDGYRMAADLGHKLVTPLPALTALKSSAPFLKKLAGVRCRVRISLLVDDKELSSDQGQLQWTDYGVSGIVVFQVSRFAVKALEEKRRTVLIINYMPEYSREDLKKMILPRGNLRSALEGLLHRKLVPVLLHEAGLWEGDTKPSALTRQEWSRLLKAIQSFPLRINGYVGYEKAQVTQGGIPLNELDDHLKSRINSGLYFAGELVDVDGICGGYNLHWAWASGLAAGSNAALEIIKEAGGLPV